MNEAGFFYVCVCPSSLDLARDRKKFGKKAHILNMDGICLFMLSIRYTDLPQKLDHPQNMWKKVFYVWKNNRQRAACLHWHRNQFVMAFKATRFRFWRVFFPLYLCVCVLFFIFFRITWHLFASQQRNHLFAFAKLVSSLCRFFTPTV